MARAAAVASKKRKSIRVDFAGVETQSVLPEGEFIFKVTGVKLEETGEGNDYLAWSLKVTGGKHDGKNAYHNTSLQPQSLWATKRWLECLGVEVPDGELDLDLEEYVDLEIGGVVEHEVWKGKTRSRIIDCFPAEGEADEKADEDDEKPAKKGAGKTTAKASKKKDEPELPSDEDVEGMGKAELRGLVEEHELGVELTGTTSAMRRAVIKALAAKRKEDDDEPEEKPAKKGAAAKEKPAKKVKKVPSSTVEEADEDVLTELIEKHGLEVDLDDFGTLRKKRGAVMDALEEKDLLEESDD